MLICPRCGIPLHLPTEPHEDYRPSPVECSAECWRPDAAEIAPQDDRRDAAEARAAA